MVPGEKTGHRFRRSLRGSGHRREAFRGSKSETATLATRIFRVGSGFSGMFPAGTCVEEKFSVEVDLDSMRLDREGELLLGEVGGEEAEGSAPFSIACEEVVESAEGAGFANDNLVDEAVDVFGCMFLGGFWAGQR